MVWQEVSNFCFIRLLLKNAIKRHYDFLPTSHYNFLLNRKYNFILTSKYGPAGNLQEYIISVPIQLSQACTGFNDNIQIIRRETDKYFQFGFLSTDQYFPLKKTSRGTVLFHLYKKLVMVIEQIVYYNF